MNVSFNWAEFNIKFDIDALDNISKLNLVNLIIDRSGIDLTSKQIKKLDKWINTTKQTKS